MLYDLRERDIGRKSRFFLPHAFSAAVRGRCRSIAILFDTEKLECYGKARIMWLSDNEIRLTICLAVSTDYRRVTDRQTDILRQHSPRYA